VIEKKNDEAKHDLLRLIAELQSTLSEKEQARTAIELKLRETDRQLRSEAKLNAKREEGLKQAAQALSHERTKIDLGGMVKRMQSLGMWRSWRFWQAALGVHKKINRTSWSERCLSCHRRK
jgi:hypothetical protein